MLQLVAQIFANALARKRTEIAPRDHADKFQTISSSTTAGFWVVDKNGRILEANDECCRLKQQASALTHELSQPLGAILLNAEAAALMLQTVTPDLEELRAIVKDILSDGHRASLVIERLRSLLKRQTLDPQPIAQQSVLDEVLPLVHADANARHVTLACSAAADLTAIPGDRIHDL
ncbi:MAG: histidine kinase dimerization/phospho-acceptor domain-containing protein [Verrucomicrobiota bacterium]